MQSEPPKNTHPQKVTLLLGVLLIALCLRGPITSVAPLLSIIESQLQMSMMQLSLLTTLPLLAFAMVSPLASRMGVAFGIERTLFASLLLIILGTGIRSTNDITALYVGTFIIGCAIALANVLLPSLIKKAFANKITAVTSAYVLMMGVGATISAGVAVPIAHYASSTGSMGESWTFSLLTVAIIPAIALLVWLPQILIKRQPKPKNSANRHSYIWRSAEAWSVTLYLTVNLFLMYIFVAWLPAILTAHGYTEEQAGALHGLLQLSTVIPAFVLGPLLKVCPSKRFVAVGLAILTVLGILGISLYPAASALWCGFIGFGVGGSLIIAMSLLSSKAKTSEQAAVLSGMSQCVSYSIAALGPILAGLLFDVTHSWFVPLLGCALIGAVWCYFAYRAVNSNMIKDNSVNQYSAKTV